MPYKEKEITKIYYTIGEVAGMFNVNVSLIRFYEKEFDFIKPHKNKKGNRLFTKADVDSFKRIFCLIKEQGCSLSEVKDIISKGSRYPVSDEKSIKEELYSRLTKTKSMLQKLKSDLDN